METFVRVLEAGSFSGAARQLGLGQPALSKSVAQLEERLGVKLLLRSARGLTATEAGQKFYERAKRAIEEADEADLAARGAGRGLTGRLRFSAAVTFARLQVVPRLPAFLAQHPDLAIDAVLDDRNIDLVEEGIDVALRMGALPDSALAARRIGRSRRLLLAAPAYLERQGPPATPRDLPGHRAVLYAQGGGGAAWTFRRDAEEVPVVLAGSFRTTAAEAVREAVLAGLGLCVASEWMFGPELDSGRVKVLLPDWALPPIDLWAAFPTGRRASAKARAFADFVAQQMRETRFAP